MSLALCRLDVGAIYSFSLEGEGWGEGVGLSNWAGCGSLVFALILTLSPRRGDSMPNPVAQERGRGGLTLCPLRRRHNLPPSPLREMAGVRGCLV